MSKIYLKVTLKKQLASSSLLDMDAVFVYHRVYPYPEIQLKRIISLTSWFLGSTFFLMLISVQFPDTFPPFECNQLIVFNDNNFSSSLLKIRNNIQVVKLKSFKNIITVSTLLVHSGKSQFPFQPHLLRNISMKKIIYMQTYININFNILLQHIICSYNSYIYFNVKAYKMKS